MINKTLVTSLILQGFLIHVLVLNLYAEELLEKGTSDRSNVESEAPISVQALKSSYFLSNHINQFSNYNLNALSNPSYKSPWVAFLLSYIIPGSGQIYNGEITKGLLFTGTILLGAGIALIPAIGATSGSDWPVSSYIGAGIAGIAYIWQVIDAPVSANRINEENNLSFLKINVLNNHQVSLGLSTEMLNNTPAPGLALNYKVPIF